MITPKIGNHYVLHHSGGNIVARFIACREIPGYRNNFGNQVRNATRRYHFINLKTGREIIIKSRTKIRSLWSSGGWTNNP